MQLHKVKEKWNKKDSVVILILILFYIIWTARAWLGYSFLDLYDYNTLNSQLYWGFTKILWIPFTIGLSYFYFKKINLAIQKLDKRFIWWILISIILLAGYFAFIWLSNPNQFSDFNYLPYKGVYQWFEYIIIIAFGEELLFRGFILTWLQTKFHLIWAIIFSSILFTLVHYCWWIFVGLNTFEAGLSVFVTGLLLGLIKHYSKNIFNSTIAHFLFNYIVAGFGF